ncbi:MAG: hypothetical protein AAF645_19950 [Myxococcota bacterium]
MRKRPVILAAAFGVTALVALRPLFGERVDSRTCGGGDCWEEDEEGNPIKGTTAGRPSILESLPE